MCLDWAYGVNRLNDIYFILSTGNEKCIFNKWGETLQNIVRDNYLEHRGKCLIYSG